MNFPLSKLLSQMNTQAILFFAKKLEHKYKEWGHAGDQNEKMRFLHELGYPYFQALHLLW